MIKLSFLIVVVIGVQAFCPSNSQIPQFQTATLQLQSFSANNIFTHTFGYKFKSNPAIAIGIMDLSYNGQNDPNYNHFSIKTSSVNPTQAAFLLNPSRQGNWQNIQINFWASSRQQIILGSAHVNLGSLQGRSVTKFLTVSPIPNHISSIIRPFLNGFSFNSPSTDIDIHIQGTSLKSNQIPLMISAGQGTNLKQIWVSYIIFSPSSLSFASYGGLAAEVGFKDTAHTNIHTIIHETPNIIIGLTKLKASLSKQFTFSSSVDSDFILSYQNTENPIDFFLTYLVMGAAPSKLCSTCSDKYAYDSQCVKQCPSNTYPFTYRDKGKGCRKCSAKLNEVVNSQRTGCVKSETPLTSFEPVRLSPVATTSAPSKSSTNLTSDSCKLKENSYWTGYRCACRVGYKQSRQTGLCEKMIITLPKPKVIQTPTCGSGEIYNGTECVCKENYYRNSNGACVENQVPTCPANSKLVNQQCVCNPGFRKSGQVCISVCGSNSKYVDGRCVCNPGYVMSQGGCVKEGKKCPPNSTLASNGQCRCNPGFKEISSGFCSRCDEGQYWDGNSCIYTCGINQVFDSRKGQCRCKDGYGYMNSVCSLCSGQYFLHEGYCVVCPINSYYNQNQKTCTCESGYQLLNGICSPKCSGDQVYSPGANVCKCAAGLGRINGVCQVCPIGQEPDPGSGDCSQCSSNKQFINGRCQCLAGFGVDSTGYCVKCEDRGLVLLNGVCGSCPSGKSWNGNECACPSGTQEINGVCSQKCEGSQLADQFGQCYYCPLFEEPVNGACQCKQGYSRNGNGVCEIKCKAHQVLINGLCATCSLNTVYNPVLRSCVCPDGFYLNNYGVCEKRDLIPVTCDDGFYYSEDEGCVSCPFGCKTCQNANKCLTCTGQGYVPAGNSCIPNCGDGRIIRGIEQCDDSNKKSGDGCSSSCMVEDNYRCSGEPSICENIAPPPPTSNCGNGQKDGSEGCDDGNSNNGDGCSSTCSVENGYSCDSSSPSICTKAARNIKLVGNVINNSAAVYLTVQTTPAFKFNNEQEMRQFMKYSFTNNAGPSQAYCNQRFGNGAFFDCIFLYPSGVPLMSFVVELSFEREGKSGYIAIPIDTNNSVFSLRSLN